MTLTQYHGKLLLERYVATNVKTNLLEQFKNPKRTNPRLLIAVYIFSSILLCRTHAVVALQVLMKRTLSVDLHVHEDSGSGSETEESSFASLVEEHR